MSLVYPLDFASRSSWRRPIISALTEEHMPWWTEKPPRGPRNTPLAPAEPSCSLTLHQYSAYGLEVLSIWWTINSRMYYQLWMVMILCLQGFLDFSCSFFDKWIWFMGFKHGIFKTAKASPFPQPPEGSGEEKIPPSIVLVERLKIWVHPSSKR